MIRLSLGMMPLSVPGHLGFTPTAVITGLCKRFSSPPHDRNLASSASVREWEFRPNMVPVEVCADDTWRGHMPAEVFLIFLSAKLSPPGTLADEF